MGQSWTQSLRSPRSRSGWCGQDTPLSQASVSTSMKWGTGSADLGGLRWLAECLARSSAAWTLVVVMRVSKPGAQERPFKWHAAQLPSRESAGSLAASRLAPPWPSKAVCCLGAVSRRLPLPCGETARGAPHASFCLHFGVWPTPGPWPVGCLFMPLRSGSGVIST